MPASVVDLEAYRGRLAEAYASEHGPLRFVGASLSLDGESVHLQVRDGEPTELSGAAALALGRQLQALGEYVLGRGDW